MKPSEVALAAGALLFTVLAVVFFPYPQDEKTKVRDACFAEFSHNLTAMNDCIRTRSQQNR